MKFQLQEKMRIPRICKNLLLLLVLFPLLGTSQIIRWQGDKATLDIGAQVTILEDPGGTLSIDDVSSDAYLAAFKPSGSPNLILGYTLSVFWVKFSLDNPSGNPLMLEISQAGLPDCDLYFKLDGSGTFNSYRAGSNTPFHQRHIKSSFQVFPLQSGTHDYYIRLTTNSGPIPLKIYDQNTYEEKSLSLKFVYGIYLGLMLFVFLSNLFFYISLRNYLYLVNALVVIIFTCYSMVVVDGFIVYFFEKVDMLFWYTTIPPLGVTIQTIYSLWFLEVKKYSPRIYKFVIGVILVYAAWFVLKFFLSFPVVQPINTLQALLSFFIMGFVGIRVGKAGNKFGYYFAWTYIVYFLLVLAEAAYINTGKPAYLLGFSYSGYATVIEALVLSFLLSKRFEWEKEEIEQAKALAQKQLLDSTLENERIVRDQNITLERKVDERTYELKAEKEKSDQLLLNILPEETAQELKMHGKAQARIYNLVTVLFTDFQGFTGISEKLSPSELVEEIDGFFSAFDRILDKYNIEKIKTVGDAYIAVAGVPRPNPNHAFDVVEAALEFRAYVEQRRAEKIAQGQMPFEIRIGIHSGTVVAGIVGIKKFAYDIWGDAVNIASRMESSGEIGKINISAATYSLVKDKYQCTHRGKIFAKNKGDVDMYFVERLHG